MRCNLCFPPFSLSSLTTGRDSTGCRHWAATSFVSERSVSFEQTRNQTQASFGCLWSMRSHSKQKYWRAESETSTTCKMWRSQVFERYKTNTKVTEDSSPREIRLRARASEVGVRNVFPSLNRPVLNVYSCWRRVSTRIQSRIVLPAARFSHSTTLLQTLAFSIHYQQVTLVKALQHARNTLGGSWQTCTCLTQKSIESELQGNSTLYVLRGDAVQTEALVSANKKLNKTVSEIPERFLSKRNATSLTGSGGAKAPGIVLPTL